MKARLVSFLGELGWMVEKGGGEPVGSIGRVAVLAVLEVLVDDLSKCGIKDETTGDAVHQGGESRDRRPEHQAAGFEDPGGLREGLDPIGTLDEVVERAKEENGIAGAIWLVQGTGIADRGTEQRRRPCPLASLVDLVFDGINQMDIMALRSEPCRIRAGRAAHVEDPQGRGRQMSGEDFLGAS